MRAAKRVAREKAAADRARAKRWVAAMEVDPEIQKRIDGLDDELDFDIAKYTLLALLNYGFAHALMIGTLLASGLAGFAGLFADQSAIRIIGAIALLPGAFAVAVTVLRPQGKANWHTKKCERLRGLRLVLRYGLSKPPSENDLAKIVQSWKDIDSEMTWEWKRLYALHWSLRSGRASDS